MVAGNGRKRLVAAKNTNLGLVGRVQSQLIQLLRQRLVLAQLQDGGRAQRDAVRAEERVLVDDLLDKAAEAIAPLVPGLVRKRTRRGSRGPTGTRRRAARASPGRSW